MRSLFAATVALAPLCWLAGCGSPGETPAFPEEWVGLPPESVGESLRINEVKVLGINDTVGLPFEGAVEITNIGDTPIHLSNYSVRTDSVDIWRLPNVTLQPGAFHVARSLDAVGGSSTAFLSHATRRVALIDWTGRLLDGLDIPASVSGGVLAKYPNGIGSAYVYPLNRASLGAMNPDIGFVRKLAAGAEFSQRDSSPNAILTYGGYHWILGGWSNFGGDEWHSFSDVWKSSDGIRWSLVNAAPPYVHYSAFVAWRERMWAIGPSSFSSEDGIEWRREPIEAPALGRAVVFRDSLVSIYGSTVMVSDDGERWTTLTDTAPWGSDRVQPTVLVYDDKIWVMGGTGGATDEVYFNDVWTSADGMTWSLVNPYADWTPRLWTSGVVYDGKIFLINGMSLTEWFEEYGQTAEIWFTEDGVEWFQLEAELKWAVRHASLTTVDEQNGVLLLAGYGLGGVERLYNDVWSLRAKIFFSKAQGDLRNLDTWGKRKDGSGEPPRSFDAADQVFMLRNRDAFAIDESWSVTGAGSRIFIGDGQRSHSVELQIVNRTQPNQPLYLLANSTTIVSGCPPNVLFKHPQAALIGGSTQCARPGKEDEHTE